MSKVVPKLPHQSEWLAQLLANAERKCKLNFASVGDSLPITALFERHVKFDELHELMFDVQVSFHNQAHIVLARKIKIEYGGLNAHTGV